ncbi:MarR family winged helix-turn-helix transcriptional regulator [Rhodovibrionaceae bacterium A322]
MTERQKNVKRNDVIEDGEIEAYTLDEQVGFKLRQANQRHAVIFSEEIPGQLTPTQFAALAKLQEIGTCSQNQLGRLTSMDVATTKGVVERLKARELLTISPDPNDRRRTLLNLTDKGRTAVSEAIPVGIRITRRTLAPLTKREQATFLRLLDKLA